MILYDPMPDYLTIETTRTIVLGTVNRDDFLGETSEIYDHDMFEIFEFGRIGIDTVLEKYTVNKPEKLRFFQYKKDPAKLIVLLNNNIDDEFFQVLAIADNFFKWKYQKQMLQ